MFPSKSDGMFVPESLIFRSDSNGEDLEGYAGAGLYDSITMDKTKLKKVDYNGDRYGIHQHCVNAAFWTRLPEAFEDRSADPQYLAIFFGDQTVVETCLATANKDLLLFMQADDRLCLLFGLDVPSLQSRVCY